MNVQEAVVFELMTVNHNVDIPEIGGCSCRMQDYSVSDVSRQWPVIFHKVFPMLQCYKRLNFTSNDMFVLQSIWGILLFLHDHLTQL